MHRIAPFEKETDNAALGSQRDIRRALIEADREMPSAELRTTNRVAPTSTFVLHPSNFASIDIRNSKFEISSVPVCLWFLAKSNNTDAGLKGLGYVL